MAPYSSTLVWKIPWVEKPGGLQSMGSQRVRHTEQLHFHFHLLPLYGFHPHDASEKGTEAPRV